MKTNNFDTNKNGLNIEFTIDRDCDLAQWWFEDCFSILSTNSGSLLNDCYRGVDVYLFTDHGNIVNDFDLSGLENYEIKGTTKKEILEAIKNKFYEESDYFKDDALQYFDKYPYQLTKLELIELVENAYTYDYQEFLTETFKKNYTVISSRGCC